MEWIDSRLPIGRFTYFTLDRVEDKEFNDEALFRPSILRAVEREFTNELIRISIIPEGRKDMTDEHWVASGVTHHAFRYGVPIDTTVDGYRKVEAQEVTRHDPQEIENSFYLSLFDFSKSFRETSAKHEEVIMKMNSKPD